MTAFDTAWALLKMPFQYHLTDNPNFVLDPHYEPKDNTISMYDRSGRKGIYTSPKDKIERWLNSEGYWRPYVVELEMDEATLEGTEGRWGGERFIPASSFDNLSVRRVMPLDVLAREEYGSHGWIADELGLTFEGEELEGGLYPFRGMDFSHIDARKMTQEQIDRIQNDFDDFMRSRGYGE